MQRNIREASSIINTGLLAPLITILILARLFCCSNISLASLYIMIAINQQLANTANNVRPQPINNAHLVASYLWFLIVDKVNLAKCWWLTYWWNNANNKMINLTLYSKGRIEASHSDLVTAKDSHLEFLRLLKMLIITISILTQVLQEWL